MVTWFLTAAMAAPPAGLRPAVAPWDAVEQYAAYAAATGKSGALACEPLWPMEARVCFKLRDGNRLRWVTTDDLTAWGTTASALVEHVRANHPEIAAEVVAIEGMDASYVRLRDGEGWAALAALDPRVVAAQLGGPPILVAMPSEGVAVAWKPGDPAVDTVMAIGVRELYDAQPGAVSPAIHAWGAEGFALFGRAEPTP